MNYYGTALYGSVEFMGGRIPTSEDDVLDVPRWDTPRGPWGGPTEPTEGGDDPGDIPPLVFTDRTHPRGVPPEIQWPPTDGSRVTIINSSGNRERVTVDVVRTYLYYIEARDSDGVLVASITEWWGGELILEVDQASGVTFEIDATSAAAAYMVPGYQVWIRDRFGFYVDRFNIRGAEEIHEGDRTVLRVDARGMIYQWQREPVLNYSTPWASPTPDLPEVQTAATVRAILEDLIALQQQTPAVVLGDIDPQIAEYEVKFDARDTNLLEAVRKLQGLLPKRLAGHFWVDSRGAFQWYVAIGLGGQSLAIGRGLQGIRRRVNWDDLVTRLYIYGEGNDPRSRLKLTDAGEANEYKDAATVGTYGIQPRIIIDRRLTAADTLLLAADRILEELSVPQYEVEVQALDLAKSDTAGFNTEEEFYPGSTYNVVDATLGINTSVTVQRIRYNMQQPLRVGLELANRTRRVEDIIAAVLEQTRQPLDVNDDGSRYPNIGRVYEGDEDIDGLRYRYTDLRWSTAEERIEHWHEVREDWEPIKNCQYFKVTTVNANDLTCGAYDPATGTSSGSVKVRKAVFGDVTYAADDIILATFIETGLDDVYWQHVGGAGEDAVETVLVLPAIPASGELRVFWTSAGAGTGDDQIWATYAGETRYWPQWFTSSLSGVP